jgi:hypothetical protein
MESLQTSSGFGNHHQFVDVGSGSQPCQVRPAMACKGSYYGYEARDRAAGRFDSRTQMS